MNVNNDVDCDISVISEGANPKASANEITPFSGHGSLVSHDGSRKYSIASSSHLDVKTQESIKEEIARKETSMVTRLKFGVLSCLAIAAVATALIIYITADTGETNQYKIQLNGAYKKISHSFVGVAAKRIETMAAMKIITVIEGMHDVWPFVTVPSFQESSKNILDSSGALLLVFHPRIDDNDTQRSQWENYVSSNASDWM